MQAFLLSAVGQDFQPPDRAEGVQPEQVKLLTCLKTPASPIHTRHIPKKLAVMQAFLLSAEWKNFQPATAATSCAI
jgi:hypothetical protein